MSFADVTNDPVQISVRNVGGIDETEVSFSPGVTVLSGRNATNRTSLLRAIMGVLGSDDVALKADADEGRVELEVAGETYTRTLDRRNDTIVTGGDPYLEDSTVADLFAFLLESNEARRTVARGGDLRELIMRPVDTDAIQAEISQLEAEKRQVDERLENLSSLESDLPALEARRRRLKEQIDEKEENLEAIESEIEDFDASVDETREERAELEDKLDELRSVRGDLDSVRYRIESEQKSIEALEDERDDLEAELDEVPDHPAGRIEELDAEIERLRDRKQRLDSTVSELQTVIQFNEEMLSGASDGVADALREDDEEQGGSVTDQLVEGDSVVCWTCGSDVDREKIEETLSRLRDVRQDQLSERNRIDERIDEVQSELSNYQERQREREQVERRQQDVEREIEQREETLERLEERREELRESVQRLEDKVEDLEAEEHSDLLELHREANQLEFDIGRLESDLEDAESEIDSIETRLEEREELQARREEIQAGLEELRTRIERIEENAVEQFNDHMEAILDILDYDNLERIWIERTETETREGRRKVTRRTFDLHVIRRAESGATYEDTIDHLSESEREVTGLVFALAGYLVHEVYQTVPFMLLDSLEAIDSDRIARLVEYFEEYAGHLVVALLPEDASALSEDFQRVTEI